MAPHDTLNSRQTEAPAGEFSREERIEQFLLGLSVHPAARVRHFDIDIIAFRQGVVQSGQRRNGGRVQVVPIAVHRPCGDCDDTAFVADGLRGVDNKIQNDLVNLSCVAVKRQQVVG